MPETDNALPTVNIPGIEIFSAGSFNGDTYTEADLDSMIAAFDKVGFKPTVKAGHADGQESEREARKVFGAPALGYVSRLYRSGKKLLADVVDVPRRFANLIKAKTFSRVSAEIYWAYRANDGENYPRVLKSVAFLGADIPALTNLAAIETLFSRNEAGNLCAYDENKNEFRLYEVDAADLRRYVIRKNGDQWCLYTHDGSKLLGCHDSEEGALAQERAVQANKQEEVAMKREVWLTREDMGQLCQPCAETMAAKNLTAIKVGEYQDDGSFKLYINLPENTVKGLCDKFGDANGFRTRCMEHMKGRVDSEGAFCNSLKESCFGSVTAEADDQTSRTYAGDMPITQNDQGQFCVSYGGESKCFPTRAAAEEHCATMKADMGGGSKQMMSNKQGSKKAYAKGGDRMDGEEEKGKVLDGELLEQLRAEVRAEVTKEYDYRVHKAREDGKAEAEKENEELRASIRKLESEKRSERIEHWLKTMKAEGKIAPAEESRVRTLREWIPDEGEELKHFEQKNGKITERKDNPARIFESLFEARQSVFKVFSKDTSDELDQGTPLDDAGAEVDRRAKNYQQQQQVAGNKVAYDKALKHVLSTDAGLALRYNQMQKQ